MTLIASRRLQLHRVLKPQTINTACIMSIDPSLLFPIFWKFPARNLSKVMRIQKLSHCIICRPDCHCSRLLNIVAEGCHSSSSMNVALKIIRFIICFSHSFLFHNDSNCHIATFNEFSTSFFLTVALYITHYYKFNVDFILALPLTFLNDNILYFYDFNLSQ